MPEKDGKYMMTYNGESRIVSVEINNDRIYDHDQNCHRSLRSMLDLGATFTPVEE